MPAVRTYYRKADQAEGIELELFESTGAALICSIILHDGLLTNAIETAFTFHRADLQKVLLDHVQTSHAIHLCKRLASYTPTQDEQAVVLHFQDGATATCNVLVGADGIRSAVREAMFTQLARAAQDSGRTEEAAGLKACIPPVLSGYVTYRSLIHKADLPDDDVQHPVFNRAGMSVVSHALFESRSATERCNTSQYVGKNKVCPTLSHGEWRFSKTPLSSTSSCTQYPRVGLSTSPALWEIKVRQVSRTMDHGRHLRRKERWRSCTWVGNPKCKLY